MLLVHGWNGRATQLYRFITPLQQQGYRVLGFDAPAHGHSSGNHTNLAEVSNVILEISRIYGGFHCIVAHSIGGLASLMATIEGAVTNNIFASTLRRVLKVPSGGLPPI